MHPLIKAYIALAELQGSEPQPGGLYWPMWYGMVEEVREFIREFPPCPTIEYAT